MLPQPAIAGAGSGHDAPPDAGSEQAAATSWLLCREGALLCALPVEQVGGVMRLLPTEPIAGAPPYLRGLAVIGGVPVPVVDLGLVIGTAPSTARRLVTIEDEGRMVALAVDDVVGVAPIAADTFSELPPLLRGATTQTVAAVGAADARLLMVLRTSRIVPDDVLARIDAQRARQ